MNTVAKTEVDTIVETYNTPLAELNPAKVERFKADTLWPIFERLRREDPVHFTPESEFGPYWSITRWADIMAVDTDHAGFSSAEGIGLANLERHGGAGQSDDRDGPGAAAARRCRIHHHGRTRAQRASQGRQPDGRTAQRREDGAARA